MTSAEVGLRRRQCGAVSTLSKYSSDFCSNFTKKKNTKTPLQSQILFITFAFRYTVEIYSRFFFFFITKTAVLIPQGSAVQEEISFMSCLVAQSSPLLHRSFFFFFSPLSDAASKYLIPKSSALNVRLPCLPVPTRAEPILTRMKEDHTRIILPAIDNIKYNTFEVQQYANAAHGYNWGLWCMYIIPPQEWLDRGDETAPIR